MHAGVAILASILAALRKPAMYADDRWLAKSESRLQRYAVGTAEVPFLSS